MPRGQIGPCWQRACTEGSRCMNRRQFLRTGLLGGAALVGAPMLNLGRCRLFASPAPAISTRAADLVLGSGVIDMLSLFTLDWPALWRWHKGRDTFGERDYRALEIAGIDIFHPAVETSSKNPTAAAERWLAGWSRLLSAPRAASWGRSTPRRRCAPCRAREDRRHPRAAELEPLRRDRGRGAVPSPRPATLPAHLQRAQRARLRLLRAARTPASPSSAPRWSRR